VQKMTTKNKTQHQTQKNVKMYSKDIQKKKTTKKKKRLQNRKKTTKTINYKKKKMLN